ncbi:hypothetical protein [Halomonas nitroreducens]|uniref:DNA gyrase subunit B n=1 Tax=Halomonas nitroreducens TaxID=447425 RepID=A0A3S0R4J2_9GAMM|nr:hypothetical protein [Halomonas nitroreducens]RTR07126.1 hypothetical protein EKG36_01360 [Halomonas nitroreducens]
MSRSRFPSLVTALTAAGLLAWPLLVLVLLPRLGAAPLLGLIVLLAAWRLPAAHRRWALVPCLAALAMVVLGRAELGVRAWPVAVNAGLLVVFATSLCRPPCVVERLARRQDPDLSAAGVRYTRRVTGLWCGFFLVNGSLALWTALAADLALWTLYNGAIAYALGAALFAAEWCIRQRVRNRHRDYPRSASE